MTNKPKMDTRGIWSFTTPKPRKDVSSQPTSRLLQLPGELRNRIYQYALSYDKPLIYFDQLGRTTLCIKPPRNSQYAPRILGIYDDANPLKLVNRQMYHETRGMTLGNNDLTFESTNRSEAQCVRFLKSIAPCYIASLRRITIRFDNMTAQRWNASYEDLRSFCLGNPKMTLCLRSHHLSRKSKFNIFTTGVSNAFYAGRVLPIYKKLFPEGDERVSAMAMDEHAFRQYNSPAEPEFPSNLRIFPWDEDLDEAFFQAQFYNLFSKFPGSVVPCRDVEVWRPIVQDWYRDGM